MFSVQSSELLPVCFLRNAVWALRLQELGGREPPEADQAAYSLLQRLEALLLVQQLLLHLRELPLQLLNLRGEISVSTRVCE